MGLSPEYECGAGYQCRTRVDSVEARLRDGQSTEDVLEEYQPHFCCAFSGFLPLFIRTQHYNQVTAGSNILIIKFPLFGLKFLL